MHELGHRQLFKLGEGIVIGIANHRLYTSHDTCSVIIAEEVNVLCFPNFVFS